MASAFLGTSERQTARQLLVASKVEGLVRVMPFANRFGLFEGVYVSNSRLHLYRWRLYYPTRFFTTLLWTCQIEPLSKWFGRDVFQLPSFLILPRGQMDWKSCDSWSQTKYEGMNQHSDQPQLFVETFSSIVDCWMLQFTSASLVQWIAFPTCTGWARTNWKDRSKGCSLPAANVSWCLPMFAKPSLGEIGIDQLKR